MKVGTIIFGDRILTKKVWQEQILSSNIIAPELYLVCKAITTNPTVTTKVPH